MNNQERDNLEERWNELGYELMDLQHKINILDIDSWELLDEYSGELEALAEEAHQVQLLLGGEIW